MLVKDLEKWQVSIMNVGGGDKHERRMYVNSRIGKKNIGINIGCDCDFKGRCAWMVKKYESTKGL